MTFRRLLAAFVAVSAAVVPAAHARPAKITLGDRHLEQGMQGRDIRVLQDFLTRVGLVTPVDGHYGPATARRVRSWERKTNIPVDGRLSTAEARILRTQVEHGVRVHQSTPRAAAPAPESAAAITTPGEKATIGPDGKAIAPASAPEAVKQIIAAANEIHDKPYRYGGGHGRWQDSGYDCSGSVSYALRGAGLLSQALNSTGFMSWGEAGAGSWVTIYANPGHAYMVVAGLRYDTSGRASRNSRWTTDIRSQKGFTARHPKGL